MKNSLLKKGMLVRGTGTNENRPGGELGGMFIGKLLKLDRFVETGSIRGYDPMHEGEKVWGHWSFRDPVTDERLHYVLHPSQFKVEGRLRDKNGRFIKSQSEPKKEEEKISHKEKLVRKFLDIITKAEGWSGLRGSGLGPCYSLKLPAAHQSMQNSDEYEAYMRAFLRYRKKVGGHGMYHMHTNVNEPRHKDILEAAQRVGAIIIETNSIHVGHYKCWWIVINQPKDWKEESV